jgi:hypothetical protein
MSVNTPKNINALAILQFLHHYRKTTWGDSIVITSSSFDKSMVSFDPIIQIFILSYFNSCFILFINVIYARCI